jgi:membrane-bound serine protease (ClpP class)
VWVGLIVLGMLAAPWVARGQEDVPPGVYVLTFSGPVTPILERYIQDGLRAAESTGAQAIILQLDTPGGSVEVTQSIIQTMLASPVPIVVYVAPAGARAGSAGTFITLAGHLAAMAPNTSIGAASPVDMSGADIDETLAAKITNILSADIENLAQRRGEAATEWAIAAVQDAAAATAQQARDLGVIDIIATDLDDLLRQIDGRTVDLPAGPTSLRTASAVATPLDMPPLQRTLNFLVDPTLASILLSLAILSLVIEIRTPGFGFAGIFGVLCLLLAFYALGQLDANLTGLAFMAVALGLFVAEAFTPTFGVLTAGGIVAFVFGGALLFNTPGLPTPWLTLILVAVALGALTVFVSLKALAAQHRPIRSGGETLIGATARVKAPFAAGETGSVFVQGEWWNARLTQGAVTKDDLVLIVGREGLTLTVTPAPEPPPPVAPDRRPSTHSPTTTRE